jgi:hypothetical protein
VEQLLLVLVLLLLYLLLLLLYLLVKRLDEGVLRLYLDSAVRNEFLYVKLPVANSAQLSPVLESFVLIAWERLRLHETWLACGVSTELTMIINMLIYYQYLMSL